jgi:hypothetical protein
MPSRKRFTCPIYRVHPDGSTCTHKVKPKPGDQYEFCPGLGGYDATCSCGETLGRQPIRAILEEKRLSHLHRHTTTPARGQMVPELGRQVHSIRTVELPEPSDGNDA